MFILPPSSHGASPGGSYHHPPLAMFALPSTTSITPSFPWEFLPPPTCDFRSTSSSHGVSSQVLPVTIFSACGHATSPRRSSLRPSSNVFDVLPQRFQQLSALERLDQTIAFIKCILLVPSSRADAICENIDTSSNTQHEHVASG